MIVIKDNEQGGGSKSKCEAQKKSDDQKEAGSEKSYKIRETQPHEGT